MLTLFTTPKPFHGHFGLIQRNALKSWTLLEPSCEIIAFGDEDGTAAVAAELGLRHVPNVARNEFGMPLVRSLFEEAKRIARTPFIGYANADNIFMNDLGAAVRRLASVSDRFLLIGQRYELAVDKPLAFQAGWQAQIRSRVIDGGVSLGGGNDYFIFPRALWGDIPSTLCVGRAGWDNWPLYEARLRRAIVVDATPVVMAVHQSHDYSHHPGGMKGVYRGLEGDRNYGTLGGVRNVLSTLDATHLLTDQGLWPRCRSCYPLCVCKPASF